ncbi:MAG: hypothetical protein N4A45_01280 [Flavobacteriales bacterium]|jgi:hypothetical protein|nr:hypothetical protein [Flavobacteriales bacterium]
MKKLLVFSFLLLMLGSCKTQDYLAVKYGMFTDIYPNTQVVQITETPDGDTQINIPLRKNQVLHIQTPEDFDDFTRNSLRDADMWISRPYDDPPLKCFKRKKVKVLKGDKKKEIYIDAHFGFGNDIISVQGRFFVQKGS